MSADAERELQELRKALHLAPGGSVIKALLARVGTAVYDATAATLEAVERRERQIGNGHHLAQKFAEEVKVRLGFLRGAPLPEPELRGRVVRHERRTLRERDVLALEMTRQGWEDGPGYRALQDALDAIDARDFALRAVADLLGLPDDSDPLDDLDGLVEALKTHVARAKGAVDSVNAMTHHLAMTRKALVLVFGETAMRSAWPLP